MYHCSGNLHQRLFPLVCLIVCLITNLPAQTDLDKTDNASQSLRTAQFFISQDAFEKAEKQLLHTLQIKEDFAIAHRLLGRVYLELGRFDLAVESLEKSFKLNDKLSRAAWFECGEAYLQLNNPNKALGCFERYQAAAGERYANKKKEEDLEATYDLQVERKKKNCNYLLSLRIEEIQEIVSPLADHLNTENDEYMPSLSPNGKELLFTRMDKEGHERLYQSTRNEKEWSAEKRLPSFLVESYNEGMARFAPNGKKIIFAGSAWEGFLVGCALFAVDAGIREKGRQVVPLIDFHELEDWDSQPAISCDGKTLFFASNRDGGYGGTDIWFIRLQDDGSWSLPQNAGSQINSDADEESPYIAADNKTLFFSSNGHDGLGDADFFISRWEADHWTTPQNLGYPINSTAKELGFYLMQDHKTLLFSSSRSGGKGGLDLYQAQLPSGFRPEPTINLTGRVINAVADLPVEVEILLIGMSSKQTLKSDSSGYFYTCLPSNNSYTFVVEADGFQDYMEAAYLAENDPQELIIELFPKDKGSMNAYGKAYEEKRIHFFFEFDSYALTPSVKNDLEALVKLVKGESFWKVDIVGLADPTGDAGYNFQLSQKRAQAIANYLKASGINSNSIIKIEGLGSGTSEDAGLVENRRVDVILRH